MLKSGEGIYLLLSFAFGWRKSIRLVTAMLSYMTVIFVHGKKGAELDFKHGLDESRNHDHLSLALECR